MRASRWCLVSANAGLRDPGSGGRRRAAALTGNALETRGRGSVAGAGRPPGNWAFCGRFHCRRAGWPFASVTVRQGMEAWGRPEVVTAWLIGAVAISS